jgi:opacity protein-like surface antigen
MKKFALATAAAAALTLGALAASPADAAGVKVGVLTCHVSSGFGFIFGSSKDLYCNYRPNAGEGEHYVGTVKKFGVDLGYTEGGEIIWGVIAPTSSLRRGALEGGYGGVSASAAVGVGVGANALIGGFDRSITLQPLSIEGMKGLNVAAGIGAIDLKYAP